MNRVIKRILSLTLCTALSVPVLLTGPESKAATAITKFEALSGPTGAGAARISWNKDGDRVYKVYKSTDGVNYETVGVNFEEIESVKVLQIYPNASSANQLQQWMVNNGYGKGLIKVSAVSIDAYNSNPYAYLKSGNEWKYDVIFFGTWDCNGGKNLSQTAALATEAFIKSGRGCIMGHDTIGYTWTGSGIKNTGFAYLRNYFGLKCGHWGNPVGADYNQQWGYISSQVHIVKKGLFTTYPWNIGEVGTVLNIPTAHTTDNAAKNENVWLEFHNGYYNAGQAPAALKNQGYSDTYYLSTQNNCAMIQTGHSSGAATVDEQKILANLIFYSVQLHSNSPITDNSAMDYAAPNKPVISLASENYNQANFTVSATDNGTQYYYKIEEFDKTDTTRALSTANTAGRITTGIKGYRYVVDSNPNTTVTYNNTLSGSNISVTRTNNVQYLHVAAIDGTGNVGATNHYKIMAKDTKAPIISSITEYTNEMTAKDDDSNIANEYVTGIKGYCVTQTQAKPAVNQFTEKPDFKVNRSGYNYVWAIDEAGNISKPYKIWIHSDLYYEGTEINRVFYNGVEVFEYNFEGNNVFF